MYVPKIEDNWILVNSSDFYHNSLLSVAVGGLMINTYNSHNNLLKWVLTPLNGEQKERLNKLPKITANQ